LFLTLAELKMDLDNKGVGVSVKTVGGLVLNNVDMAHGLSYFYGGCLFAVNTPLTIKGGQFSDCKLIDSIGSGGAIQYSLDEASTLNKGLSISKTEFFNNTGRCGGAIGMYQKTPQVSACARVVVR